MSPYRQQLETAIRAVRFRSASEVFWFGKRASPELRRRFRRGLTPSEARAFVLTSLQDQLYANFYSKAAAYPSFEAEHQAVSRVQVTAFVERLSEANGGAGYFEPGWEVLRTDHAWADVGRSGLAIRVRPADCRLPENASWTVGQLVSVRMPKELRGRAPGCYVAMGDAWLPDGAWRDVVRLYWNVTAEGAVDLTRSATRLLNRAGLPFQLKVVTQLTRFSRCDSGVLYLRQRDYPAARRTLERLHGELAPSLRAPVPALTKPLAPGLGLAEDPGNGLSFGEHRCLLLADALIRAYELGKTSVHDRLRVVVERFGDEGIDLARPYLNPDSEDAYELAALDERRPPLVALPWTRSPRDGGDEAPSARYLDTAHRIGREIWRSARWSERRCNWMGATVDATGRTSTAALDPHLYAGTSGVAWFLAELYAATGDTMARRAALGAIEQALWKADGIAAGDRVGLFTGWIGIALAAARVGVTLNEPALLARARQLLERLEPAYAAVANADHMAGAAGAIVGLLGLREVLGEPRLTQAAIRLGETTLARATKRARDWSWKTTNRAREVNLTGFAHGAAGIACALMELWQATGDRCYRRAAELGFAYERRWFAAGARNWPDLRGYPARGVRPSDELPCGSMWCHGAPGVAMSRLRAYQITGDERWKADALVALQTTRTLTESAVRGRTTNFSLCHGLAGNAEIVAAGTDILPENFPDGPRVAADVARFGIERYGDGARPWPCGAAGPTPALMVGLAGTGYFYLRLVNPKLPSVLLLRPAAAGTAGEPPAVPAFESAPSHA